MRGFHDEVCRRFMTTSSVGAIVAIPYKSALDDPGRIKKSRNAGPLFGFTPRRYQSGETDITGGISRVGDEMVRTALRRSGHGFGRIGGGTRWTAIDPVYADEKSDGCIVPMKPRTKPKWHRRRRRWRDGGLRGEGEVRRMLRTQRRNCMSMKQRAHGSE